jgi:hypothetical protein
MAEDKIRHDDIIEKDVFRDSRESAKSFENQLNELIGTIQKVGVEASKNLGGNPKNLSELKQQQQAIQDIANADIALTEAQKQRIAVAETLSQLRVTELKQREELKRKFAEENRQEKEKLKAQKQSQDAYGKLSAKHKELRREAMNLAAAYGTESKAAKDAAAKANVLDAQLKKIDTSLGNHTRKVGEYSSAWQGVIGGFKNLLGGLGIGIGIGAVKGFLEDSVKAFADSEKNAKALAFALNNVGGEGEAAFIKLNEQAAMLQEKGGVFSDDDITKAQTQLVNYGLLSDEVEQLMPKILDLATVQGVDLATATDTVIKGINGQTRGLKTVGLDFEDTGSKAENYAIILDKLTKFEGASAEAATTTEGRYKVLMNRFDDLQESIGEFLIDEGYRFTQYWDVLTGKIDATSMALNDYRVRFNNILDPATKKTLEDILSMGAVVDKAGNTLFTAKQVQIGQIDKNILAMRKLISDMTKDGTSGIEVAKIKAIEDQIAAFQKVKADLLKDEARKPMDERIGYDKETTKKNADDWKNEWTDALKELDAERDKAYAEEEKRRKDLEAKRKKEIARQTKEYEDMRRERAMARKRNDDWEKEQARKKREEELNELIQLEEMITDATFEGINKRLDLKEKALQQEGETIDRELQIQSERQLAGLDNTYAEVSRLKAENEAKQAEIEERRRKAAEAKELADLFVEFTKAYAKDGNINAASKGLAQAIAVKAIADSIAGNFAEGVENFKGKGTGTSDSNIIGFSNGESVVTARGTAETAGLVSAINERGRDGVRDWAMENIFKPQLAAALIPEDSAKYKAGAPDWIGSALLNELVDLKKTVKEKPEYYERVNEKEKVIESILKANGITKVIKHKRY